MEIANIEEFIKYCERIHERTRRAIDNIPPDQIEWTYREGKFTLGDIIRHLASMNRYMFAEVAKQRPNRYPGHERDLADGYAEVIDYFERMHGETREILRTLTDEELQGKCMSTAGYPVSVWKWLRSMVEHEVHHRGQIYTYLGLLQAPIPPLYGLTAEEMQARMKEEQPQNTNRGDRGRSH